MKTPMKKIFLPFLLSVPLLACAPRVQAQATTQVVPRQYTLFSGLLTNNQDITTNAALPGQNIGVWTNTFIPFGNSHPLGLSVTVTTTNNMAHASNLVFNAYRAFDTVPFFSWTDAWTTNQVNNTNIPTSSWEPATSIGLTISNQCTSNVTVSV